MSLAVRTILGLVVVVALAAPAAAQKNTQKRYGDWTVVCNDQPPAGAPKCFMVQEMIDLKTKLKVFGVGIFYVDGQADPKIQINTTNKADPSKPLSLQIDNGPTLTTNFDGCNENVCRVLGNLNADLLDKMRRGTKANFTFVIKEIDKRLQLVGSLKGFSSALKSLDDVRKK